MLKQMLKQLALLALVLLAPMVAAQPAPHVRVDLVSSVTTAAPGESFTIVFRQDIDDGWHTYWLNPGDSGAPPEITWTPVEGVEIGDFRWPAPERIPYGPLMNFGYHHEVLMPFDVSLSPDFAASELQLEGSGRVLVCADICIPEKVTVALTLPVGELIQVNPAVADIVTRAESAIPVALETGASLRVGSSTGEADSLLLDTGIEVPDRHRISEVAFFPVLPDLINNTAPQEFSVSEGHLVLSMTRGFAWAETAPAQVDGLLVVTEEAGDMLTSSYQLSAAVSGAQAGGPAEEGGMGLLTAALFAFLGGLILNLMPCVFPVLSIKVLSLVEASAAGGQKPLIHGLFYTGGVVLSFVAVAVLLLGLRSAGEVIGWGFQLQSPLVVGALAYLFILIALNLFGLFEVGTSIMSLGSGGSGDGSDHGYAGSFSTGVLATLVAAPCTAPFMAAAVGFALAQPMVVTLLVFAALGLGMAVPFLLLCISPAILQRLPRPGPWMVNFRQLLAFPMLAAAIWLVWVLGIQTGATGMMQLLSGGLLLALGFWSLSAAGRSRWRIPATLVLALCVLTAGYLLVNLPSPAQASSSQATVEDVAAGGSGSSNVAYQAYSETTLVAAREKGPVFVNFTAAWCITCKVNEANALNRDGVQQAFRDLGITYLRGDWTNEDPVITRALEEYGRSGVPLYLYYRPGAERAEVLPQLLTESIVLSAIAPTP